MACRISETDHVEKSETRRSSKKVGLVDASSNGYRKLREDVWQLVVEDGDAGVCSLFLLYLVY